MADFSWLIKFNSDSGAVITSEAGPDATDVGITEKRLYVVESWQRLPNYDPQVILAADIATLAINRAMSVNFNLKRVVGAKQRVNSSARTYKLFLEMNDPRSFYEVYCEATVLKGVRDFNQQQLRAFDCDRQWNDASFFNHTVVENPSVILSRPPQ